MFSIPEVIKTTNQKNPIATRGPEQGLGVPKYVPWDQNFSVKILLYEY